MTRFFDSHAIMGVLKGEPRYRPVVKTTGYTHQMNLLESAVQLTRGGDMRPLQTIRRLGLGLVDAVDEDLLNAAALKTDPAHRKRNLSYVDALGFCVARRLGLPFLTGDAGFEGLEGVEFVRPIR
jgi:predicted nucleic acid-binding protein